MNLHFLVTKCWQTNFEMLIIVIKMSNFNSKNDLQNSYHQSNFNINFIVCKMATFQVIMNLHFLVTKYWQTKFEIFIIVILMSNFNSKIDLLNRYHQSNFNITFIVSKMATFQVIMNLHLLVTKWWQTKFEILIIVIKMSNFNSKNRSTELIPSVKFQYHLYCQ